MSPAAALISADGPVGDDASRPRSGRRRSASASASSRWCVVSRTAPPSCVRANASQTACRASRSSPVVGSSSTTSRGSPANASATATRRRSPPERPPVCRRDELSSSNRSIRALGRERALVVRADELDDLAHAQRHRKRRLLRRDAEAPARRGPSRDRRRRAARRLRPGGEGRAAARCAVDLPAPFGPSSATTSPSSIRNETPVERAGRAEALGHVLELGDAHARPRSASSEPRPRPESQSSSTL